MATTFPRTVAVAFLFALSGAIAPGCGADDSGIGGAAGEGSGGATGAGAVSGTVPGTGGGGAARGTGGIPGTGGAAGQRGDGAGTGGVTAGTGGHVGGTGGAPAGGTGGARGTGGASGSGGAAASYPACIVTGWSPGTTDNQTCGSISAPLMKDGALCVRCKTGPGSAMPDQVRDCYPDASLYFCPASPTGSCRSLCVLDCGECS